MEPIGTHWERNGSGSWQYELYPDSVVVTGYERGHVESRVEVPLAGLEPRARRVTRWNRRDLYVGIGMSLVGAYTASLWVERANFLTRFEFWACSVLFLGGLYCVIQSLRPIEDAEFRTPGGVYRFGVTKMSGDRGEFEEFVYLVSEQIPRCQDGESAADTSGESDS